MRIDWASHQLPCLRQKFLSGATHLSNRQAPRHDDRISAETKIVFRHWTENTVHLLAWEGERAIT